MGQAGSSCRWQGQSFGYVIQDYIIIRISNIITGTKLHQQTRKAISRREPALKTAIRKFNCHCDTLTNLAEAESNTTLPVPRHLSNKLATLHDNPYLMEDVWIEVRTGTAPRWLTDPDVCTGIRAMLKSDRCLEERQRLTIYVAGLDGSWLLSNLL